MAATMLSFRDDALSDADFAVVHGFLAQTYWAAGIPAATLRRALDGSLCYRGYVDGELVAFARAVTEQVKAHKRLGQALEKAAGVFLVGFGIRLGSQ